MQKGTYKRQGAKFIPRKTLLKLLDAPRSEGNARDYYLLSCLYYLALRAGEVVLLRSALFDWDESGGIVNVPSLKRKPRQNHRMDTVSGKPIMSVPILHGRRVLRAAWEWGQSRRWMFSGTVEGMPITTRRVAQIFKRWAMHVGIRRDVSVHALRHSAGSHVYDVTNDLTVVRDYLRHSNVQITDSYLHASPSSIARVREALERRARSLGS